MRTWRQHFIFWNSESAWPWNKLGTRWVFSLWKKFSWRVYVNGIFEFLITWRYQYFFQLWWGILFNAIHRKLISNVITRRDIWSRSWIPSLLSKDVVFISVFTGKAELHTNFSESFWQLINRSSMHFKLFWFSHYLIDVQWVHLWPANSKWIFLTFKFFQIVLFAKRPF